MLYSTLATVAIVLALTAAGVAVIAAILLVARRRRWAHRAVTVVLVVAGASTATAFVAAAEGQRNLQSQTGRVLALAASAERAELARHGHYTTSIARLERLEPALAVEIRIDDASVQALRGRIAHTLRLQASLGYRTSATLTLGDPSRPLRLPAPRPRRLPATGRSAV